MSYFVDARNIIIFNNCPNPVHVRQVFKANATRIDELELDKTIYLEAGEAVLVKDYKKNSLYYYIVGVSKSVPKAFNCCLPTKYEKYKFGRSKEKKNLLVVLYQGAQEHGGWGIGKHRTNIKYSVKRGMHLYDLYTEEVFRRSSILKLLRGFGEGEKYKNEVMERLETESDMREKKLKEYIEKAQESIQEYTDEQEGFTPCRQEKLSKEMWEKVRKLESAKQDYYANSEDGEKEGGLVKELENVRFYKSIYDSLSTLIGDYRKLKIIAQKKIEALKGKKSQDKLSIDQDYGDWE